MSNENEQPIPEGYRILKEHNVDPFKGSILGTVLGTLCDAGMNDLEILSVCSDFLRIIRTAVADPAMLDNLKQSHNLIKRAAEDQS